MRFWDVLFDHLVLAHLLLPWVMLAIIGVARALGIDIARFVVVQGCLIWLSCGIAIVARFGLETPSTDPMDLSVMVTAVDWQPVAGWPGIEFGVGVDGLSLWYLVTLPGLVLGMAFWESAHKTWKPRDFVCLLLAAAGITLALTARDLLLLTTGGAIALLSIALWNRSTSQPLNNGLLIWGVVVGGAFLLGTAVAVAAFLQVQEQILVADPKLSTDIDRVMFGLPQTAAAAERAHLAWKQQAETVFIAWSCAILVCVGAWPIQESLIRSLRRMTPGPRLIVVCGMLPMSTYLLVRLFLPLLGEFVGAGQGWIIGPVIVSLLWHLAMLHDCHAPEEGVLRLTMSAQLLAIVGGITGTEAGIGGAMLLSLTSGWAYAAWSLCSPKTPMQWPALALLMGCPGGGVFAGLWLIATGILFGAQQRLLSGTVLLAILGLLWMLLAGSVVRIARRQIATESQRREHRLAQAGACFLLAAIFLAGVLPNQVLKPTARDAEIVSREVLHLEGSGSP